MSGIRVATEQDVPALRHLIETSVRGLSIGFYSAEQVESELRHVVGPDTRLIADGTYYVIERDGELIAAGGWGRRATLFGGDQRKTGDEPQLDPTTEPARIRAFFVHPAWARRGLARRLFAACRAAALAEGFHTLELVATLPGEPLYAALGFTAEERFNVALPDGAELPAVRMTRRIDDESESSSPVVARPPVDGR